MQKLSVIILNFNGAGYLRKFLPSVIQFSQGHEVIVADNASSDSSMEVMRSEFPDVRTIEFSENLGYSGGYNACLEQVDSEFIVLLNSDVEVTENWIAPVLELMESDAKIAACQPKVKDYKKKSHFEYAGASGGMIDKLGYPFCRGRMFQTLEEDTQQYQDNIPCFWASGSSLFVRRNAYLQVGGLDVDFFAHMEEVDLCWRFWRSGWKVMVCPESEVFHVGGGTLEHSHPRKTYLNFRNGLAMLLKNETVTNLCWKLPVRIVLDWAAALKFTLQSGPSHGWAIFRAQCHFFVHFGKTWRKRTPTQNQLIKTKYPHSVVLAYYFKGKKTYKQLKF